MENERYSIQALSRTTSLVESNELVLPLLGGFVDVSAYKQLRFSIFPSTTLDLIVEWSHDNQRKGPTFTFRCSENVWKLDWIEVILPYVRLRIVNKSGRPCNDLVVHVWSPKNRAIPIPPPDAPKSMVVGEIVTRSLSPLSIEPPAKGKWSMHFPRKDQKDKIPLRDERLPKFIPEGSILMGGSGGKVLILPKGNIGDILMMTVDGLEYVKPANPINICQE